MISNHHPWISGLLWLTVAVFTIAYALPIMFAPHRWAARLGWILPEHRHLSTYFARCLAAAATITLAFAYARACV